MDTRVVILTAALLCSCTGPTGLLQEDLTAISLALRPGHPAEVSGELRDGLDPVAFAEAVAGRGVAIRLEMPMAQYRTILTELGDTSPSGLEIDEGESGAILVRSDQNGLTWRPAYAWRVEGGVCRIDATIEMINLTEQVWNASVELLSGDGAVLASSPGSFALSPGVTERNWWTATGPATVVDVRWGWPSPSRWGAFFLLADPGMGFEPPRNGYPMMLEDSLAVPADEVLTVTQAMIQAGRGYSGTLALTNITAGRLIARIEPGGELPSGARLSLEGTRQILQLEPGERVEIAFRLSYDG